MTATAEPAHVVEHDRFDRQALARVEVPAGLRALAERGARLLPGWPALVGDLFYVFYKAAARLRADDDPSDPFFVADFRNIRRPSSIQTTSFPGAFESSTTLIR